MDGISKLLSNDGFIVVNKSLIRELGLHEAIIIGELCSEYNYWEKCNKLDDGMFYSTRDNIEYNTGLNEHYQRKALATLKEKEIISVIKKGLPAVNYYKINFDKILNILSTSSASREELDVKDIDLNNNKTEISKQKNNSKELLQNQEFSFGKAKPKKDSLFTKCVNMIDDFVVKNDCVGTTVRHKLIEYLRYRISVTDKPLYANMWKGMLNKLEELHKQGYEYEPIIDYCIERGYLSFYPPNNSSRLRNESGSRNVPRMTQEDYEKEAERLAELEAQGVQVRF